MAIINKKNMKGMAVYFCIAVLFGGGFALLALIIKEDNDRCYYYNGRWDIGDLVRGCVALFIGVLIRFLLTNKFYNLFFS